ncbi:hypothetical protein [Caballeronia sp. Sq4a]|nr:hypothetical protein [Caballeronia sp. Sq4a]
MNASQSALDEADPSDEPVGSMQISLFVVFGIQPEALPSAGGNTAPF